MAFARAAWFQYRAMFNWATPIGYLSYKLLGPAFQILFFAQLGGFAGGRPGALYAALGNALQLAAVNGVFGVVMTVGNERQFGTLPILLASPANRLVTFFGRASVHVLDGVLGAAVGLALVAAVYRLDLGRAGLPALAGCVVLVAISTAGLGLLFGSLSLVMRDVMVIGNVVYYLLLVVCGVNFPVDRLPVWLQVISYALPLTRGVEAAREAMAGADPGRLMPLMAGELAVALAYAIAGYLVFRWIERLARRGGLQEAY